MLLTIKEERIIGLDRGEYGNRLSHLTRNSPDWQYHETVSWETGGRAPFFSRLGYGGNRSPEPVEGNAEPRFFETGRKQVAEKTSPWALERKKGFHGICLFELSISCGVKGIIEYGNLRAVWVVNGIETWRKNWKKDCVFGFASIFVPYGFCGIKQAGKLHCCKRQSQAINFAR